MAIASSSKITKSNLFSQSHANIYNLINDRDHVPLPTGLPTNHKFVRVRMPRMLGRQFEGTPFIIVQPTESDFNHADLADSKKLIDYIIRIFIYTADQTSDSTGSPSGAEQLNSITDNIIYTLNNHDDALRNYGMKNLVVEVRYESAELEQLQVFMREFELRFRQLQSTK